MKIPDDIQELLKLFKKHKVCFLLVGGYAVSAHSTPRYTEDIDLLVNCNPANAKAIFDAIEEFGLVEATGITPKTFAVAGEFIMMGRKPFRVDILSHIDGVSFEEAAYGGPIINIKGIEVPVINREALIKNKRASGRTKDLLDLENLDTKFKNS